MDAFRIDSHKLHYHVDRVARWLAGEAVAPIYLEVSPSGACNHRCVFCALDFMGYTPRLLDSTIFAGRLRELGQAGVKSIMYAGEGEPLLHKDMPALARLTREAGIDVAMTTNGVFLDAARAPEILAHAAWIKVSLNAGSPETYARIHRTKPGDFETVMGNLAAAAVWRAKHASPCTLGAQCLLLPENHDEMVALARRCREAGLDYLVVKPYSQHPQSRTRDYAAVSYTRSEELAQALAAEAGPGFQVIFRRQAMQRWEEKDKPYEHCLALPFWGYVDAGGDVWGCSMYLGDERFRLGNILTESVDRLLSGQRRAAAVALAAGELDCRQCRVNCRMDPINRYLWELRHPVPHVNFI